MKSKSIHFVGIKGVGMAGLAVLAKEAGFDVSGCDIADTFITDEVLFDAGIKPTIGFDQAHVKGKDLVITTGAHGGFDNPEITAAKELGVEYMTHGQALGEFMKGEILNRKIHGISVAGTHGKTTTTAMIATILKKARLDPSFLIGTGKIPYLNSSGHFGKGNLLVAEADEYATEPKYDKRARFLWQNPDFLVVTNIELDHPDIFKDIGQVEDAFLTFTENTKEKVIICNDDPSCKKIKSRIKKEIITYGFSKESDFILERVNIEEDKMFFWVRNKDIILGEFMLNVAGEHNALNALAAIIVCLEIGVQLKDIKEGLINFKGTKRRMEFIKKLKSGALLYDDYGHHPTEITKTLQAVKKSFPKKKILCIFQPHTYSRTKKLFEHFINSFSFADEVIFVDIYSSLREAPDSSISSSMLKEEVASRGINAKYFPTLANVVEYVVQKGYNQDWIILTMGAGDVYKISEEIN